MLTNRDDLIDSRDVIERIAELATGDNSSVLSDDELEELEALQALAEQGESIEDWEYGATLIRDTYFIEYAKELAEDCGYLNDDAAKRWPFAFIDWEAAADALQMDYTEVAFDGETYWVR